MKQHNSNIKRVLLTTREAVWYIMSVMSVCLSVYQTTVLESLNVGSLYLHIRYISFEHGSSSYMKIISKDQGHSSNKSLKMRIPAMYKLSSVTTPVP